MKVKHIITTCGIILGGIVTSALAVTSGANATLNYTGKSDVQFTFRSMLTLNLNGTPTGYTDPTFVIDDLAQSNSKNSNTVTALVNTNNVAGYTLSATVGDAVNYNNTDLNLASGSAGSDKFEMISSGTTLTAGKWGYTLNGSVYGALPLYSDTAHTAILNATRNVTGDPGSNCSLAACAGDTSHTGTNVQIGAYADSDQVHGAYQNVVNFKAVANIALHTITLNAGTNVASVEITSVNGTALSPTVVTGSWSEGTVLGITATCDAGYQFNGWNKNYDFGAIANKTLATTTYTVAGGSTNLTAYCILPTS